MQLTHPKLKTINGPTISTPRSPTHTYKKDINIATCLYTLYVNLAFNLLEMSKFKKKTVKIIFLRLSCHHKQRQATKSAGKVLREQNRRPSENGSHLKREQEKVSQHGRS